MGEDKLLPCPFCGGEAHIEHNHVYCSDCGCMPAIFDDKNDSLNSHIKLWNTRSPKVLGEGNYTFITSN